MGLSGGGIDLLEDPDGPAKEGLPVGGEFRLPLCTVEKPFAEFFLELHDLLAEGWLGDAALLSSP